MAALNSNKRGCGAIVGTSEVSPHRLSAPPFRVAAVRVVMRFDGQKQVLP